MADTRKSKTRSSAASKRQRSTASKRQNSKADTSRGNKPSGQSKESRPRRAQDGAADGRSSAGRASESTQDGRSSAGRASESTQPSRKRSSSRDGMSALEAVQHAREHLATLLGRPVEAVSGVDREHGNWIITAQVVELARVPSTTDVLGDYEAILDKKGEVLRYRRTRRYPRAQTEGGQ
jgi:gas vesicle protein GvpO